MRIMKALLIACSIYSRIPVPQFEWTEEDMKYMLCFFPWIGAVIGALLYGWFVLAEFCKMGTMDKTLIAAAIPLGVTGGFHVDGFMDSMDAFHSWQSRERRLEILKDSHIGAFAVIMLVFYGLIYLAALSELHDRDLLKIVCAGFFLARTLSGISVVTFPCAKQEGLLYTFADRAHKYRVRFALGLQGVFAAGFMLMQDKLAGGVVILTAGVAFFSYYRTCKKMLGGITGDTAGYFVLTCEEAMLMAAAGIQIGRMIWN